MPGTRHRLSGQRLGLVLVDAPPQIVALLGRGELSARGYNVSCNVALMAEETASGADGSDAHPGIVSVETRPAKTLPGIVGVLLALVGLGLIAGGGVGVTVAGPLAVLIPVGAILLLVAWPGHYVVQPNQALVLVMFGRYRGTVTEAGAI